jgi:hypothetical protein
MGLYKKVGDDKVIIWTDWIASATEIWNNICPSTILSKGNETAHLFLNWLIN